MNGYKMQLDMDEEIEKKSNNPKVWGFLLGFIGVALFLYVVDWGFLKGGITEYPLMCPSDYTEGNGCYTLRTTTYYPDKNKQVVIKKNDFNIETLKKCSVIDRKNWECKFDDESAVFGFNNGQFHSWTLRSTGTLGSLEERLKEDMQYEYVSRFRWLLESWNII